MKMELEIRKEKETPLLSRKRVTAWASYQGSTPSRVKLRSEMAKELKVKPELVILRHIYTRYGEQRCKIIAHVYKDEKTMVQLEGEQLVKKHQAPEKPAKEEKAEEKPAEAAKEEKAEEKPAEAAKEEKAEEKPAEPAKEKKAEDKPAEAAKEEKAEEKPAEPAKEEKAEDKPAEPAKEEKAEAAKEDEPAEKSDKKAE